MAILDVEDVQLGAEAEQIIREAKLAMRDWISTSLESIGDDSRELLEESAQEIDASMTEFQRQTEEIRDGLTRLDEGLSEILGQLDAGDGAAAKAAAARLSALATGLKDNLAEREKKLRSVGTTIYGVGKTAVMSARKLILP